jgi:hypothetical protein
MNTIDLASGFAKSMENDDEEYEEIESQTDDIFVKKSTNGTEKIDQILGESGSGLSPSKSGIKVFLMSSSVNDNLENDDQDGDIEDDLKSKKSVGPVIEEVSEAPKTPELLTESDLRNMHIHDLKDLSKKYGLKSN